MSVPAYVCAWRRDRGPEVCDARWKRPTASLDALVLDWIGLRGEEYALDGNVYAVTPARNVLSQWARGDEVPRNDRDPRWRSWPLRRNDAMRDRVSRERMVGATAHGSALLWGESRGTLYTADACARVGIVVTRYEPAEAGL